MLGNKDSIWVQLSGPSLYWFFSPLLIALAAQTDLFLLFICICPLRYAFIDLHAYDVSALIQNLKRK